MDLNFLVFPKPSFRCQSDVFYSHLLFIPKQQRQIKNLVLKKVSMMNNKSSEHDSVYSDNEGAPKAPYSMARQSFDFSKFKGATAPLLHKPSVKQNACDLEDEEHEVNIKQEIRTCEKRVRLPRDRNATSILKLLGSANKEKSSHSISRIADIRKIAVQSSRFTSHPRPSTVNHVTLSKLMNDLDTFKRNKPTEFKLISQLEKKYKRNESETNSIEAMKQIIPEEKSFDLEFEPAIERPTLIQDKLSFGTQMNSPQKTVPMRIFPQRSLHQLKGNEDYHYDDENPKIGPLKRFGTRTLVKLAKDKSKSTNSSLNIMHDPLEEVGRTQSPQHIMPKYNATPYGMNKLGNLFTKRRLDNFSKPLFLMEGLGARTEVSLSIRLKTDSNAIRNRNYIENPLNETESIPCLLMKPEFPTDVVLLYFHANGEDIQQCQFFCELLKTSLNVEFSNAVLGHHHGVPRL